MVRRTASTRRPSTVAELVRALNLEGKRIAVEMNGEIVPKSRYAQTRVLPATGSRSWRRSAADSGGPVAIRRRGVKWRR